MKLQFTLLLALIVFTLSAQKNLSLDHCNCEDSIDQMEPTLHGKYQRTCNNKVIIEGQFMEGKKEGLWITKSKNGKIIRKLNYSNGQLDQAIELFYSSGKVKLKGNFKNGKKDSSWQYFNKKGKVLKEGSFKEGTPTGVWKVFDKKGKKEKVVYDFNTNTYLKNNAKAFLFKKDAIIQQDNTHEWFIRKTNSEEQNEKYQNKPFEGFDISLEFHALLMEIPLDIWDTYLSQNYTATINFENKGIKSVEIQAIEGHLDDVAEIGFFAITNDIPKLKKVAHNALSLKLLEYNLSEAIWLTGPWISTAEELTIYTPYVINQFKNRKF